MTDAATSTSVAASDEKDLRRLISALFSTDPLDLVPRLTLLFVVPYHLVGNPGRIVLVLLIAVAIALPRVYRSPWTFFAIGAVRAVWQIDNWEILNNHDYLLTYWALAVGCSLLCHDVPRALARSGAIMIGLTFLFATAWKLGSGDFLNARFFEYTLLVDPRFEVIGQWGGGLTAEQVGDNHEQWKALRASSHEQSASVELASSARVRGLAQIMTWWGLLAEALLALLWIVPSQRLAVFRLRLVALVAFCVTTYLVVPVALFGGVLLTMAIAASPAHQRRLLLVTLAAVVIWSPVWNTLTSTLTS